MFKETISEVNFDIDYVNGFDHREIYDIHKKYETNEYFNDYGRGVKKYINIAYSVPKYGVMILAKEIISDNELELLKKYCQCGYHKKYWFQKYFECAYCHGCLHSFNPSQNVIKETRKYIGILNI